MAATDKKQTAQQERVQSTQVSTMTYVLAIAGRTPVAPQNVSAVVSIRLRPTDGQVRAAAGMAREVANEAQYRDDFGKRAPAPMALAESLQRARALSDECVAAEKWLAYVKAEKEVAWQHALEQSNAMQEHFDVAARADATIERRYPDTTAYFGDRALSAQRAVATRRERSRAAKKTP